MLIMKVHRIENLQKKDFKLLIKEGYHILILLVMK